MIGIAKRIGFVGINLLLVWHVFAIAISPSSMPPASPLLADASTVARPYNQALFLNHGYHYFAPNPGGSSLLEFETRPDGDIPEIAIIPDPEGYFPRLRYHRFFMLAENIWAFGEQPQREFIEAYARHFSGQLASDSISVVSVSHDPASMRRIVAGGDLKHPSSYSRERLADFQFAADGSTVSKSFAYQAAGAADIELSPTPVTTLDASEMLTPKTSEASSNEADDSQSSPAAEPSSFSPPISVQ